MEVLIVVQNTEMTGKPLTSSGFIKKNINYTKFIIFSTLNIWLWRGGDLCEFYTLHWPKAIF